MRHRLLVLAIIAAAGTASLPATPAGASHHRPPRTTIRRLDSVQRGRLGTYCWSTRRSGTCVDTFGHSWPRAQGVKWGGRARIRIRQRKEPSRLSLHAWRRVRRDGEPIGRGTRIDYRLVPHRVDGRIVARDAVFRLPRVERHFYIDMFGVWRLPTGGGDASYSFHIRTRSQIP